MQFTVVGREIRVFNRSYALLWDETSLYEHYVNRKRIMGGATTSPSVAAANESLGLRYRNRIIAFSGGSLISDVGRHGDDDAAGDQRKRKRWDGAEKTDIVFTLRQIPPQTDAVPTNPSEAHFTPLHILYIYSVLSQSHLQIQRRGMVDTRAILNSIFSRKIKINEIFLNTLPKGYTYK